MEIMGKRATDVIDNGVAKCLNIHVITYNHLSKNILRRSICRCRLALEVNSGYWK